MGARPRIYLVYCEQSQATNCLMGRKGSKRLIPEHRPGLLLSFWYIAKISKQLYKLAMSDWILDSGAYSARSQGKPIDLQEYIDFCHEMMRHPLAPAEIFALDVIGDPEASARNVETMWGAGIPAIPVFHRKEAWSYLDEMAERYPKIALGGMADLRGPRKQRFAEQCFSRVWPKPIHGLGCSSEEMLMALPWASVDASSWTIGPCKFGTWAAFNRAPLRWWGSGQDLTAEVLYYLDLEKRAQERWAREMKKLDQRTESDA